MKDVCVGGIITRDNLFLLGKRSLNKSWAPGRWDIVGGHCKKREEPLHAMQREALEETGITIVSAELLKIMQVEDKRASGNFTYYIFIILSYDGIPVNCSPEHSEMGWFTFADLCLLPLALPEYTDILKIK